MVSGRPTIHAPSFPTDVEWVGVSRPLTVEELRGKVVILDFWTAGCINCLHVIPRLRELEERFPDELVVIGVHAGKYPGERRTDAVRRARDRLGVHHPVVNDRQFRIWKAYTVDAWPTIALIDPEGRLVGLQPGEFEVEPMAEVVGRIAAEARAAGTLRPGRPDFGADPAAPAEPLGPLRYPGRAIAVGDTLFVADSGHDRVLELRPAEASGPGGLGHPAAYAIARAWGGSPGFAEGGPEDARFRDPQGLAESDGTLYVADRANHAVRAIDLAGGAVRTVAGTGSLAEGGVAAGLACSVELRSPWGLSAFDGALAISMAGSHQLWRLDLGSEQLSPLAGSGREALDDGPVRSATLAQPMGLAVGDGGLCFADAESSAVRSVGPGTGASVSTFVGTGLFDHGDRDGVGEGVLLQHDEDLAFHRGRILVADTYNHKLKTIDPANRECRTLPGDAGSGEVLLHPSGLWADDERVLVADTENHRIAWVDVRTGTVTAIAIA